MKLSLTTLFAGLLTCTAFGADAPFPAIIPLPQEVTAEAGVFSLRPDTKIVVDGPSRTTGEFLAKRLRTGTGFKFGVAKPGRAMGGAITLTTHDADSTLGAEGYELRVEPDNIVISAPTQAGLFYGEQTLLQLLPPEIFAAHPEGGVEWKIPCVKIKDQPRYPWRGMMLDVSRHFFNKHEVEHVLDAMALYKLNRFHWHLTDDQGWRIEIKKYPRLTEVGAWRDGVHFGLDPKSTTAYRADGKYGGYYTREDIREVVAYAAARHIMIVPEIEMPGHSTAALMAYPQFSCTKGPFTTDKDGGIYNGIYCPANDGTFQFLDDVLAEVFEMFPGPYVHIGGDEVPKEDWKKNAECQALMKREGLKNEDELQSWFIRRIEKFVDSRGRRLIGWSEILQGGLAPSATVMDWIGGGAEAASAGHDVVMSPMKYCYLDHYQSHDHSTEPRAIGGFLSLAQVYQFEPDPTNLPSQFHSHILGGQGNLWTEYVPNIGHAEYMIFPRECAMAEVLWSPKDSRNWNDFLQRINFNQKRLDELGVKYRPDPARVGK